jgi:hypothetical protein
MNPGYSLNTSTFISLLLVGVVCLIGCGGKTAVVEQRMGEPTFYFERYIHGINPQKISSRVYNDGYIVTTTDNIYAGDEKKVQGDFIPKSRVKGLVAFFLSEGFLDVEPLSLPAIYGGEVITITFNHGGTSHTLKFLKGTKLPDALEKCSERLMVLLQPLTED